MEEKKRPSIRQGVGEGVVHTSVCVAAAGGIIYAQPAGGKSDGPPRGQPLSMTSSGIAHPHSQTHTHAVV